MQKHGNSAALHRSGAVKIPYSIIMATSIVGLTNQTERITVQFSPERSVN
jgi:hypothetical protein